MTFYVQVENLKTALGKIESLGGRLVTGPMDIPGGERIATFADPEGHLVGLVEPGSGQS